MRIKFLGLLYFIICLFPLEGNAKEIVLSPNGRIRVAVDVKGGKPYYEVWRDKQIVVGKSALGFKTDVASLDDNF